METMQIIMVYFHDGSWYIFDEYLILGNVHYISDKSKTLKYIKNTEK